MTSQQFTEEHARALLTTLATLDQRFVQQDETLATLRAGAWSKVLAEVDPQFAMSYVFASYGEPRDYQLQVGEIRAAWHSQQAEQREAALVAAEHQEPALVGNPSMVHYLREVLDATRAGQPVSSVARPLSLQTLSRAADQRSRRCTYWDLCSCDHTACRGGMLDEEEVIINGLGKSYTAVRRCAACKDGLLMAEETGRAKRPSHTAAGKRR